MLKIELSPSSQKEQFLQHSIEIQILSHYLPVAWDALTMPISQKVWIAQGWQKFPSAGLWAFR
jgi:hypothetical protein